MEKEILHMLEYNNNNNMILTKMSLTDSKLVAHWRSLASSWVCHYVCK